MIGGFRRGRQKLPVTNQRKDWAASRKCSYRNAGDFLGNLVEWNEARGNAMRRNARFPVHRFWHVGCMVMPASARRGNRTKQTGTGTGTNVFGRTFSFPARTG